MSGLYLANESATERFGAALAKAYVVLAGQVSPRRSPSRATVVGLRGELGTGKTTVARGALRALGATGPIKSPTYTLIEHYQTPTATVLHLDLYRLADPDELELLGARDHLEEGYLWLVEWPERGRGWLPVCDLELVLDACEQGRTVAPLAFSEAGQRLLDAMLEIY